MNRKKIIIFFSILLIIIAISGYFIIKNIKKNKEETLVQEYIPQEEIGESQARQTIVSLYFPDKEKQEIKPEAIHVYNEDGEEVLTYTGGVGWQEKETKAESQVHSALKMTYYEAFSEARKALNSEEKAGSINEDIISQGNFDMKA